MNEFGKCSNAPEITLPQMFTREITDKKDLSRVDESYMSVITDVLTNGITKKDRTGVGTISKFGTQVRFSLRDGVIPLISLRKVFTRSFIHETLWFISGSTDIKYLKDNNVSIWDSWVIPDTAQYRELTEEELKDGITKYVLSQKEFSEVEFILLEEDGTDSWVVECDFGFTKREVYYDTINALRECYTFITGDEPRVLVSGSIGNGAYGAMWRNIEDTRLVPSNEIEKYLKVGFGCIGELPHKQSSLVTRNIDQLQNAIDLLRKDPDSRRIIVQAFDNRMVDFCALPPCHSFFQLWTRPLSDTERYWEAVQSGVIDARVTPYTSPKIGKVLDELNVPKRALSCQLYQRSCDTPVGGVFNIAQYGLLTHMIAHVVGMLPDEFIWTIGDAHIYKDQIEGVKELLSRKSQDTQATVVFKREVDSIDEFTFEDIEILSYKHGKVIKFPVAV